MYDSISCSNKKAVVVDLGDVSNGHRDGDGDRSMPGPPRRVACGAAAGATCRAAACPFPVLPGGAGARNLVLQQDMCLLILFCHYLCLPSGFFLG